MVDSFGRLLEVVARDSQEPLEAIELEVAALKRDGAAALRVAVLLGSPINAVPRASRTP